MSEYSETDSGRVISMRELGLQTHQDPGQPLARVLVTKGGDIRLAGGGSSEGAGLPAHSWLMRQLYPFVPLLPADTEHKRLVVYNWNIGTVAGATSSLENPLKIARPCLISGFTFGQFNPTNAIYTKNRTRWDFFRDANYHLSSSDIGDSSVVKGISDLLLGASLDRILSLMDPWRVVAGRAIGLSLRNEGASSAYFDACAYALEEDVENTPVLPPGEYELILGTARVANADYAGNRVGRTFTFQTPGGAFLLGVVGHVEGGDLAITHRCVRIRISDMGSVTRTMVGGNNNFVPDQLVFGAEGQRPLILPNPLYYEENNGLVFEIVDDIDSAPDNPNYEFAVLYLARAHRGY